MLGEHEFDVKAELMPFSDLVYGIHYECGKKQFLLSHDMPNETRWRDLSQSAYCLPQKEVVGPIP